MKTVIISDNADGFVRPMTDGQSRMLKDIGAESKMFYNGYKILFGFRTAERIKGVPAVINVLYNYYWNLMLRVIAFGILSRYDHCCKRYPECFFKKSL